MAFPRRPALLLTVLLTLGSLTAANTATAATTGPDPIPSLTSAAHPLRTTEPTGPTADLRPLGRMIGGAKVVGLGEATHSSHEFFANKHRVLRYLVEEKGFTAFALEANWSSGLRIDDYVVHGKGDIRKIMREEFQDAYRLWNTREYLDLIEWMRTYNAQHARKIHFVGNDAAYAGPEPFDRVADYVRAHHPALLPRLTELYRAQRPVPGVGVGDAMQGLLKRPLAERRAMAADARTALDLLAGQRADGDRREFELALQHARAISQVAGMYAFDFGDPKGVADGMRYRDEVMAANTAWWHERTGAKVLLSAHNAHVSYVSDDPGSYPRMQGAFLRDRLGRGYVNVRLTFDRGAFNALDDKGRTRVVTLDPARPGSNEHTLDRVPHRDYALDMRTAPAPARKWLEEARLTRNIGTSYPEPERMTALASSYDILIHLHRVREAGLLAP
ncbi:erythromycin esterase family protein [Streptomyces albireticuli]|uniref:Erythromycin esterase n=1 Tax=Streptomyces albireticuli TaxID=1940 RepID=A0A2A2D6I5_9ACTN|nr:erythromycin esterase family protein [Streptomyces albireticuli]MCD9143477.1 erythromycin esterase family protein [Streptomyces albireticuli]MCD9164836.1 erythromycin esterase family protein [Streptomyces albireticuli]MCD9191594.1 erythromycin esterase family protein [Streptomyces albireticuli]PAU47134.1 erythromycin esterase [Streptomyces albireticuli]